MEFKDKSLSGILRSLAADEYLAWMQYYFNKLVAQGKSLNYLDKVFDENGEDELEDHFNKLVTWMQSKDILIETDFNKMQEISNYPYFAFGDGAESLSLIQHQIKSEQEAIDAYSQAMIEPEVVKYPDLVVILGEICADEREHLKNLNDLVSGFKDSLDTEIDDEDLEKKNFMHPLVTAAVAGAASGVAKSLLSNDFSERLNRAFELVVESDILGRPVLATKFDSK